MMKLFAAARFATALLMMTCIALSCQQKSSSTDKYEFVGEHEEDDGDPSTDFVGSLEYEFDMLKDPATGKIPEGAFEAEMEQARQILSNQLMSTARVMVNNYSFQGPNNLGGRTRALVYDVRFNGGSNQVIIAGGVSGGIYKSTNDGASWTRKSPTDQHFSVTSVAQDPRPGFQDTWYYTTGEGSGNSANATGAGYSGNGVYKSTDNGETWTRLTNSNTTALETFSVAEDYITKVAVNPANGDVYIACMATIRRSQDGGTNWATVLNGTLVNSGQHTDIVINSTGTRLYAAFSGTVTAGTATGGVYSSTTGNSGDWTKIAGTGATTNPATWNALNTFGRVVLALAPSDESILYALYWNGTTYSSCAAPSPEAEFFRWDFTGPGNADGAWTDLSANLPNETGCSIGNDPFAVQSGYDLIVAVKPDNPTVVFLGGTNLYRSTDGFTTTTNTTRIGGYANTSGYALYTNSHSDIHAIAFEPGSAAEMLCGNDGGIQKTANNLAGTVAWTQQNAGFRTYQYYYVTNDPRNSNDKVLGGAQDNGTTRNVGGTGTSFEQVRSGDGCSVGLSNLISGNTYEYVGVQNGVINRRNSLSAPDAVTNIRPTTATDNGLFVTLFHLDPDNTETLYYASDSSLYRNTTASTATTVTGWTQMTGVASTIVDGVTPKTQIRAFATTRGTYNAATASLFIGTGEGRLYRLDDPFNAAAGAVPVNITGAGFTAGANISSIAVNPRNDDTVLVTFSNYGATVGIWWTGNANSATPTWVNVEDNLNLTSIRSSAIAVTSTGVQYFVGTSTGLYTGSIDAANPGNTNWAQEGPSDIGNAVVSSLALRTSDNKLLVGTHGYGMWSTTLTLFGLPVTMTSFEGKTAGKSNNLYWTVENETNNKGFELQRSYGATASFETVGFLEAKENATRKNSYAMEDKLVDLGKANAFYRLKQVDKDGKTSYSKTIVLNRSVSPRIVEYISASQSSLLIRINNGSPGTRMRLRILDASGKEVQRKDLVYQTQSIDIGALPSGVYATEIINNRNEKWIGKFVK